ncbi:choice-of-anchor J domain-containing protein [Flavobacterium sp.]|uniref:choice-of-anchor J domain-containing protein n=1 Tax=Flavobacterium sp. TaxID=239 RepID=UPI0037503CBC
MKTIKFFTIGLFLVSLTGCSPENDIKNSDLTPYSFYEEFVSVTEATEGQPLDIAGWTNFAQAGTKKWRQGFYSGTKYAEFTAYTPIIPDREVLNIGWLISPAINMDVYENEKLAFDCAQAYVSSASNSIELLVSTDYDGTNVLTATWQNITFNKPPLDFDTNFDFFSSGIIDMSSYTGNIYLAFKVKGSGTNSSLDGTYELDNIRIFDKK